MIRERGLKVRYPERTFATVDHIVPTEKPSLVRPFKDGLAEQMLVTLQKNCNEFDIKLFDLGDRGQGIVHVIGPELGLTQSGMVIACGDSHTSTHGAFGSIAFGIGTTQVAGVLASQCLLVQKPKVRRIVVSGTTPDGVYAKDIILAIIQKLGVKGGIGFAYEYAGSAIEALDMEGRMTLCNMSIEGGATCGYVNPDDTTFDYVCDDRQFVPKGGPLRQLIDWWETLRTEADAEFDDVVEIDGSSLQPMVTWGTNPGQSIGINEKIPNDADGAALAYMGFKAGQQIAGTKVDVAFIGSCTNGRLSDLREAAEIVKKYGLKVAPCVKALVVPGSQMVREQAIAERLDEVFIHAGFEWREAGCSMCLAMNPDKLQGNQLCASTSNRNFKGRQGSPTGRTLLMSPASVVASAAKGEVASVSQL